MPHEPLTRLTSRTFVLAETNIDTDQIIPARFLTTTDKTALGEACFCDWRFDGEGKPTDSALNKVDTTRNAILVAGENFGCGSSREHAPWALLDFGFRAVVTSGAADIFKSNAAKNGLLVAEIDEEPHRVLIAKPDMQVTLDVENGTLEGEGVFARFELEPFGRTCLLRGLDPLDFILSQADSIAAFEQSRQAAA